MNRKSRNRKVRALILSVSLGLTLVYAGVGLAQERNAALQENDKQLTTIEGLFKQVEAAKATDDKDKAADDLGSRLDAYAKAMVASFEAALKQAELAAKSQGKEGNTEQLKTFEDLAVKHENRLKQLDNRAKKMQPKSGSIWEPGKDGKTAFVRPVLQKIGEFFISPAEAAIALSVYSACHRSPPNQAACVQGIATGVTQTAAAQATYRACWERLDGVRPKWWRDIRRVACVTALVARLA
jgi:hypothetical protein